MINCLIVDDNLHNIQGLINLLEDSRSEEFQVYYSLSKNRESIEKDIQKDLSWLPQVILLDLAMAEKPGDSKDSLGGITFLKNVRSGSLEPKISPQIPVIVLSGYNAIDTFEREHSHELYKVFVKPADPYEVLDTLKEAVEGEKKE